MNSFLKVCFIVLCGFAYSQANINPLVDSLSLSENDSEKIRLSLKIADRLKFEDWDRAEYYLDFARSKADQVHPSSLSAEFYMEAAEIYYDLDAFDIALEYYLEAYEYYKDNSSEKQYEIENVLAIIYSRLNSGERAYFYFKKVYEYYKSKNDFENMAKGLNNLGSLFLNNGKPDSALIYLKESQDILKRVDNNQLKAYILTNLGRSYMLKGKPEEAGKYFNQAAESAESLDELEIRNYVYNQNAFFWLDTGDYDKSIEFGLKAKDLGAPYYSFSNYRTYQVLYKAYLAKGDYKEASSYFTEYDMIWDSLDIERKAVNVEKQRIEQDFKNKEEINLLQAKQKRSNLTIVILLLLLTTLTLVLFLFKYRSRFSKLNLENELTKLQKRELELSLELKNKELTTKAMLEINRSEFFSSLQEEIAAGQKINNLEEMKAAMKSIGKKVSRNSSEEIWEDFEMSFSNVHESFFEKLSHTHPNLTVFDKRICALIKLNLSTKEIAALSKSSVKSIENLRTRLRKKMGLTNQKIEIYDYLSQF